MQDHGFPMALEVTVLLKMDCAVVDVLLAQFDQELPPRQCGG